MSGIGVFGVGSPFGDDRIGWEAIRAAQELGFAQRHGLQRLEACDRPGTHLLALLQGLDSAIVIDAMHSGAPPGTLRRLDSAELGSLHGTHSTHGFGLAYTLSLGKMLDALPPRLVLYGMEIAATSPQDGLSDAVAQAIPQLLQAIACELAGDLSTNAPACPPSL